MTRTFSFIGQHRAARRGRAGIPARNHSSNDKKSGARRRAPLASYLDDRDSGVPDGADRLFAFLLRAQAQRDVARDRIASGAAGWADHVQDHEAALLHLAELAAVLGDGLDRDAIHFGDYVALAQPLLEPLGDARHAGHQDALGLVRQVELVQDLRRQIVHRDPELALVRLLALAAALLGLARLLENVLAAVRQLGVERHFLAVAQHGQLDARAGLLGRHQAHDLAGALDGL